jgi:hypothetical protein
LFVWFAVSIFSNKGSFANHYSTALAHPDNRMDKTGIHHVDSIVFLCYGFLSLAKTLRAQRVSRYSRCAFRADRYKREKAVERTDHPAVQQAACTGADYENPSFATMAGDAKRLAGAWPAGGGLRLMLENKPVKNILFLLRKKDRTFDRRF